MSDAEDFVKLRDAFDRAESLVAGKRGQTNDQGHLEEMDAILSEALPLMESLGMTTQLDDIREAQRKRNKGIPVQSSYWMMERVLELQSACDLYTRRQLRRTRQTQPLMPQATKQQRYEFVSLSRIEELRSLRSTEYDFSKLIRLCEEINIAHANDCHIAVASLVRTVGNHVPPIFGAGSISDIAAQSTKSVKELLTRLADSMKHIADHHLHDQIKKKVSLPTEVQVNCSRELDVLLGEIVRKTDSA